MRDVMLSQDCLYPLVERSLEGDQARIIGSIHIGPENRRPLSIYKGTGTSAFQEFCSETTFTRYYWVKYGNLVERDHGPPAEGAARFDATRWSIVMRAALSQVQWRQSALAGLCRLYWYPLYIFARCRGHSRAEINQKIHAFCEALIATGGRLGP